MAWSREIYDRLGHLHPRKQCVAQYKLLRAVLHAAGTTPTPKLIASNSLSTKQSGCRFSYGISQLIYRNCIFKQSLIDWQQTSVGSDNGLVANRWKAFIWTKWLLSSWTHMCITPPPRSVKLRRPRSLHRGRCKRIEMYINSTHISIDTVMIRLNIFIFGQNYMVIYSVMYNLP